MRSAKNAYMCSVESSPEGSHDKACPFCRYRWEQSLQKFVKTMDASISYYPIPAGVGGMPGPMPMQGNMGMVPPHMSGMDRYSPPSSPPSILGV